MPPPAKRRMPGMARRMKLLEGAREIVRQHGVAGLTLANLAAFCGVSKPIAYNHFGTRERLLAEIYQELGAQHEASARAALAAWHSPAADRPAAMRALAAALIDCLLQNGQAYDEIMAALLASADGRQMATDLSEAVVSAYAATLAELDLDRAKARAVVRAMIGAAQGLTTAVRSNEIDRDEAAAMLARLMANP